MTINSNGGDVMKQPAYAFGQKVYFRQGFSYYSSLIRAVKNCGDTYEYTVWGHQGELPRMEREIASSLEELKTIHRDIEKRKYEEQIAMIDGWRESK